VSYSKKLFDNQPELSNSTIIRDLETIQYPFLTLIGGMTPDDLAPHAKKGLLYGRMAFFHGLLLFVPRMTLGEINGFQTVIWKYRNI
jgi:hypothetical protein